VQTISLGNVFTQGDSAQTSNFRISSKENSEVIGLLMCCSRKNHSCAEPCPSTSCTFSMRSRGKKGFLINARRFRALISSTTQ